MLMLEVVKFLLQGLWLIEGVDGDVQSAQHTLGVGNELWVGRVFTMHPLEEIARLRRLCKGSATKQYIALRQWQFI